MHVGERFYEHSELLQFGFNRVGQNVKIKRNVGLFFTENISIGDNVRIDDFTIIVASREAVVIGSNVNLAAFCYVAGSEGVEFGDFSTFAPGVMIFSGSDDYHGHKLTGATIPKKYTGGEHGKVRIGRHCIVGANSVILPKVTLGEGVSVGALSLVRKNLEPWTIYAGNPLKLIKTRSQELLELEKNYFQDMHPKKF